MSVNVGILGAGFMARTHINNLQKIENVNIMCICDVNIESAFKLKQDVELDLARVYADFSEMLETEKLDALYICIPPFSHSGQLEEAVSRNIHVFIEKPIAMNLERAESMVRAVEQAGVISQVGYHMRYGHAVERLHNMILDGSAGLPTLFDARYECNSLHGPWWMDKTKSNGQICEQVIHLYDLSAYLLGKPVRTCGFLSNLCHNNVPGYSIEDTSSSVTLFESGAMASISASNCAVPQKWNYPFTVVCSKLTAYFSNANEAKFVYTGKEELKHENVSNSTNMYLEESISFINSILGKELQRCPIRDGFSSLKFVDSVIKSSIQENCMIL